MDQSYDVASFFQHRNNGLVVFLFVARPMLPAALGPEQGRGTAEQITLLNDGVDTSTQPRGGNICKD